MPAQHEPAVDADRPVVFGNAVLAVDDQRADARVLEDVALDADRREVRVPELAAGKRFLFGRNVQDA
jgi:hypothetical protein